jgi:hypothetical protein
VKELKSIIAQRESITEDELALLDTSPGLNNKSVTILSFLLSFF